MRGFAPALLLLALFAPVAALADTGPGGWRVVDSLVARVDDGAITLSDLRAELLCEEREDPEERKVERSPETVVKDMVRRKLLVTQARKLRMEVEAGEVGGEVEELAAAGRGPSEFWARLKGLGLDRAEISKRVEEVALARSYMTLKRRSTYVAESEVRAHYRENKREFEGIALADVRDEIRERLASLKFEADIDSWISAQVRLGRVRYLSLPAGFAR